jgi:hypothetical protein
MPFVSGGGEGDPLELRRKRSWKYALVRRTGTVSVDTADAGAIVHPDGVARILSRGILRVGDRKHHELTGQDFRHISRIFGSQPFRYDDGGFDPTSLGNYDLSMDYIVPGTFPWAPRGSLDVRIPSVGVNNAFQIEPQWNGETPAGGGDAGTQALLAADPNSAVEMSWASEPVDEVVEEIEPTGDPLPLYLPMTTTWQTDFFSGANDELRLEIDTNKPVMAATILSFQRARTSQQPEDLINEVSFFGMEDWKDIPRELLETRELKDFPGVQDTDVGSLTVLLARGGKHSARITPEDYTERAITFDVNAPSSGDGRIRVILWHPIRVNPGSEVREVRNPGQG